MTRKNPAVSTHSKEKRRRDSRFGRKHRAFRRSKAGTIRVLIAGQVPPPVCGQNLNIARVLGLLQGNPQFQAEHWAFRFTPQWSQVRRAGLGKAIELIRVWGRLLRLRARGPIDAILFPVGGPHLAPILRDIALLPLARLCSRRVVLHFRAAGFAEALPRFPGPVRWLIQKTYQACGEAVVLTEYGKRDPEAAGIAADKIEVIHNACEDRYRSEWRKSRVPGDPITILNVGLLCPDKGTPALVEAFARIARDRPQLRLRLVGEPMGGATAESLLDIAGQCGVADQIDLSGVLRGDDLDRAFAEADLFVFSTVAPFESFGMVLIEAMMWGLPIVATDWRGNAEVLGPNPGGLLAPTGKDLTVSLEFHLGQALDDSRNWPEWGALNRKRFLTGYQIEGLETRLAAALGKKAAD